MAFRPSADIDFCQLAFNLSVFFTLLLSWNREDHLFSLALAFAAQQTRFLGLQWQLFICNRALLIFNGGCSPTMLNRLRGHQTASMHVGLKTRNIAPVSLRNPRARQHPDLHAIRSIMFAVT